MTREVGIVPFVTAGAVVVVIIIIKHTTDIVVIVHKHIVVVSGGSSSSSLEKNRRTRRSLIGRLVRVHTKVAGCSKVCHVAKFGHVAGTLGNDALLKEWVGVVDCGCKDRMFLGVGVCLVRDMENMR